MKAAVYEQTGAASGVSPDHGGRDSVTGTG